MFSDNEGRMLPGQVWVPRPPMGPPGYLAGEATFSATPLSWTPARWVRLARSLQEGRPVEQPSVVACRYTSAGR
ncbi:glucoamylase [Cystobacter fuscus DSM 2262]|uniref:Glucoamylase n=1 Tax=Cystobacter fuscus (strain ATCC 25194 / DSM 2262 / NBRC 100088 / M29) TaxID=1242864 RepID=S9QHY3_CYSF2|nr:hypothetical protein [Cystobacter fuscus]EPX56053.1 glucoamylase [Cystobacter fuscus DSM 2262]